MALDKLTIIDGGGLSTTSDYRVGVITATKFVGPVEGSITSTDATFTGSVSIGGTLTYEDVTNIDSVGLITARNGIEVSTGTATTALVVNGDARVTGILTVGTGSLTLDGPNNLVNVGTALTLGHTQGLQFHTQNLHSEGFEVNQINVSGVSTFSNDVRFQTANGGNIFIDKSDNTIRLGESVGLFYGTNKMWMQHNGSVGYLHNVTGSLYIRNEDSSGDIYIQGKSGEHSIICNYDGNVQLYNDGTIRFNTTATGVTVHGSAPDLKIRQGTSSNSGSGFLAYENVDGNGTPRSIAKIQGKTAGNGGYGELIFQTAFNNSLSTRLTIDSSGTVTVNNTLNANTKLNVGATSVGFTPHTTSWATGAAVNLKGNYGGGITFNDNGNSGFSVYVDGGGNNFHIKNGAVGGSLEHSIRCVKDGTVELFHNGEAKILTKSNGATVQDLTATGAYLDITSSSGSNGKVYGVSGTTIGFLDNQNHWLMKGIKDGSVELNFDNLKKLSTNSTGIEIHANEGNNANIHMTADEGDDNGDQWLLQSQAATNNFNIYNDTSGSLALKLSLKTTGNLDLYGNLIIPDAIVHTGDTDTKIVFTDNQIDLQTGGSSRIYANNSAVYVKSGFPLAFLASSGPTPNIKSGGTNNQDLLFTTGSGNPTRMQINSAGSVGIGTASIATNKKLDVCDGIISVQGTGSHDSRIEFNRTNTGALGWIGIPNWHADGLYIYGPTSNSNEIASKYASGAWSFYTSGSSNSVKLHITADGNIGFNRTNVNAGDSQTQTMTATPSRIVFNNHYSNGYTDASLKLYLFNDGATRQGFTSGPIYDLQYHSSGHATYARHAFYTQNLERLRIEGTGNTDVKKGLRVSGEDAAWGSGSEGAFMDYYASGSMVRLGHVNGQSGSAKNIVFYTGGSEKVRITSGGILEIDRGSAINQAIDIKTTATSGASRIRFMQSGTQEAQMAFSHDNNQLEIIAHAGNDVVLFSNNTINQRIDTNGHITAPNNVAFCARGGPSDVTDAVVVFGTIVFQRGGTNYSTSTGEFTAPVSGIYHFMCNPYRYQDSVDSVLFLEKSTNGGSSWTQEIEIRAMNNYGGDNGRGWFSLPLSNLLEMNANDKARIKAVRRVHCNGTFSRFSGFLVA